MGQGSARRDAKGPFWGFIVAMPTYHYRCDACSHAFDAFQKFSEDPLRVCPECESGIRRVIQPTPVLFKGSGWYINDSKAKSNGSAKSKDDGGDGKTEAATATTTATDGKVEAKVDGKAAAKSEVKSETAPIKKEVAAAPAD